MYFSRAGHDTIELALEGSNRFVINNQTDSAANLMSIMYDTGRVGLGTTAPADSLHISQSNPGIRLSDSTSGREVDLRQVGTQFIIRDIANNAAFIEANLSNNPVTVQSQGVWTFKRDTTIEGDLTVDGIVTAQGIPYRVCFCFYHVFIGIYQVR